MSERFREPRIGMGRIYTRTGDAGETGLVGGQRVPKDDPRIEAYGTVDEVNCFVGLARVECGADARLAPLAGALLRVQHQLFNLGSVLATLPEEVGPAQARVVPADIEWLEHQMDAATAGLAPLTSFILPGGPGPNGSLHVARAVCRRAERLAVRLHRAGGCGDLEVRYLNRLSDALFVWARLASAAAGAAETLWNPNQA